MLKVEYLWRDALNKDEWHKRTTIVPDTEPLERHYRSNGCHITILNVEEYMGAEESA